MYAHVLERKFKSWSKKVVFNLLTHLFINSYVICKGTSTQPTTRLGYIKNTIYLLAHDYHCDTDDDLFSKDTISFPGKNETVCIVCSDKTKLNIDHKKVESCVY